MRSNRVMEKILKPAKSLLLINFVRVSNWCRLINFGRVLPSKKIITSSCHPILAMSHLSLFTDCEFMEWCGSLSVNKALFNATRVSCIDEFIFKVICITMHCHPLTTFSTLSLIRKLTLCNLFSPLQSQLTHSMHSVDFYWPMVFMRNKNVVHRTI